jgi:phosphate transport system permease protein
VLATTTVARPRAPWWALGLSVGGAVATLGGGVLVVGYVVAGLHAGPVAWGQLLSSKIWYPTGALYGVTAMLWGTAVVSAVALLLAVPVGWAAAVALSEHLPPRLARPLRAGVELLAAVPSIVYGLVGIALVRPLVARIGHVAGGDSLLAAGLVLAVMVLPTVVAVSVDALRAVPQDVREAARALGLTSSEVVRSAVLPLARPGMRAAVLLALARALGETIAVFLVIGRADGRLPHPGRALQSLFEPGQTLTTKLGGPEPVLAGAVGAHRAALCAVGVLLLAAVALSTVLGASVRQRVAHPHGRLGLPRPAWGLSRAARCRLRRLLRAAAVLLPLALLLGIVALVASRGTVALSPSFWIQPPVGASGGGVRDQILGTLLLVLAAGVLAVPVGLGLGLVLAEWAPSRLVRPLRTATLTLGGVPTILLGLAGYAVFSTAFGWGKSWLAGALVLAVVVIPVVALSTAVRLDQHPAADREAALALGLTRLQVVRSVLLPWALPAVVTGALLGLARAAGETAPILFTATVFAGATALPHGVVQAPVEALPTHIFALAQDAADPAAVDAAWGSALVLIVLAGLLLLLAVPARRRLERP